jgi:hypothetical protein
MFLRTSSTNREQFGKRDEADPVKTRDIGCRTHRLGQLTGQKDSGWQDTGAGFSLAQFLDYTDSASLCNSPPPSPSRSPAILSIVPESEICSQQMVSLGNQKRSLMTGKTTSMLLPP